MIDGVLLLLPNLILVGDLDFTLGANEIWGIKVQLDPLAPFFSQLIADHNLVDLYPTYVGPTWRNGRSGIDGISKRLDRFLLSDSIVSSLHRHRVGHHHRISQIIIRFVWNGMWMVLHRVSLSNLTGPGC